MHEKTKARIEERLRVAREKGYLVVRGITEGVEGLWLLECSREQRPKVLVRMYKRCAKVTMEFPDYASYGLNAAGRRRVAAFAAMYDLPGPVFEWVRDIPKFYLHQLNEGRCDFRVSPEIAEKIAQRLVEIVRDPALVELVK